MLPTTANADSSVEIILDASSSMARPLTQGGAKIDAAKEAVTDFVRTLPAGTRLGIRAYGHQSPDRRRDCRDTQLLVDFEPAPAVRRTVIRQAERLRPRGYSPIALSLKRAARDISSERTARHVLVLVSDGKETCTGDPCQATRQLTRAYPKLTVHAIGFDVGDVARRQLQCIARVGGGAYYDAVNATELTERLQEASIKLTPTGPRDVIVIEAPEAGILTIKNPSNRHIIRDVETGDVVTAIGKSRPSAPVPPGIYNVSFGNGTWKSIDVIGGRETILTPGELRINNTSIMGHKVLDAETKDIVGEVTPGDDSIALVPDTVMVQFGKALWTDVRIVEGGRTVLNPGVLAIAGAKLTGPRMREYPVYDETGLSVGMLSMSNPKIPLPPGDYSVDVIGQKVAVTLSEGETKVLRVE